MTTTAPSLETYLKLLTTREKAIAANMANVDTPGYRTRDINFESELNRAMSGPSMEMEGGGADTVQLLPVVRQVQGLMERPDGNNVNLDHEGLLMAETQLQYQLGIQLIKRHFHQILSAVNGGGN
jgi:flagellar basal-body rod protein FlgB